MTIPTPTSAPRARPRGVGLAIGLVVLIVILAAGYMFFARGPGQEFTSPAGSTVATFSGNGNQTTTTFTVREGWRIDWQHAAKFAFAIRGDRDFGTVISEEKSGSGVTSPVGAGTFHLEVTANGSWTIKVIQGD